MSENSTETQEINNEPSAFSAEQLSIINNLLEQQASKINQSLNGLAARLTKSVVKAEPEEQQESSERLSLKALQSKINDLQAKLEEGDKRRKAAVIDAAIAPYASKALDGKAFKTLLLAEVGESLQLDEQTGNIFIEKGEEVEALDSYLDKFVSQGAGRLLIAPETQKKVDAKLNPKSKEGAAFTEQEILKGFLEEFSKPVY